METPLPLQFMDETGINPLPAGIQVSVYPSTGPQTALTLIGMAWTEPGGYCNITPVQSVTYVAAFIGNQAPQSQAPFTGGAPATTTVVTCPNYRSPSLSTDGYAVEQTNIWPTGPGWFGDAAKVPGGTAYALAEGNGAMLEVLDLSTQSVLSSMRLQSSMGGDIDTWAFDFLGPFLSRFPSFADIDDAHWIAFVMAFLGGQKTTRPGIQAIVQAFYTCIELELAAAYAGGITYDGGGGYDSQGGFDQPIGFNPSSILPSVFVWDRNYRPDLANLYNVNPSNDNGDFVIQLGFNPQFADGWFLDHSHLDFETFLIDDVTYVLSPTAPDPRLANVVNLYKAAGARPLYLTMLATS